jgi:hypothetical protein
VEGVAFSASEKLGFCETCVVCKSHVRRISREPAGRSVGVFEVLGLDFCGPVSFLSLGGRLYNLCAVDFRSRFMLHDAIRSKAEAPASFRRMSTTIRSLGHTVRRRRVGNDTVLLGAAFRNLLYEFNMAVEITAPYAHWQHGRIERQWGALVPMAQSMIRQAALSKSYWALAMAAAVHVCNRMDSGGSVGVPFTMATGRRADSSSMRVFGCPPYVHVDKSQRRKLYDRAWKGVFVGYASESPAWLVYNPATRRVVSSRDMVLDEATVLSMGENNMEQRNDDDEDNIPPTMCSDKPDTRSGESPQHSGSMEDERDIHSGETPRPKYNLRSTASPQQYVPSPRYNLRSTRAPGDGWTAGNTVAIKPTNNHIVQEHVSYKQALRSPQSGKCEGAIKSEYDSFVSQNPFTLFPCYAGRKLVDAKWVFKLMGRLQSPVSTSIPLPSAYVQGSYLSSYSLVLCY